MYRERSAGREDWETQGRGGKKKSPACSRGKCKSKKGKKFSSDLRPVFKSVAVNLPV